VTNDPTQTLEVNTSVAVFDSAVTNNGIFKTTAANVTFNATYSGGGSLVSDPSTQTFNQDFSVSASGSIVGTAGDFWRFGANVTVTTINNTGWDTRHSEIDFFGSPGNHNLTYPGLDLGQTSLAYLNNFAWGIVNVAAGNKLLNTSEGALYTDQLILGGGTAQIGTFTGNLTIYYDPTDPVNSYLGNQTYSFASGNGMVAPVPEPSTTLAIVFGSLVTGFRRRRNSSFPIHIRRPRGN
jgi:hypothetical protein